MGNLPRRGDTLRKDPSTIRESSTAGFSAAGQFIGDRIRGKKDDRVIGRPPYIHVDDEVLHSFYDPSLGLGQQGTEATILARRIAAFNQLQRNSWPLFRDNIQKIGEIESPDSPRRHVLARLAEYITVDFTHRPGRVRNVSDDDLYQTAMDRDSCFLGSQDEGKDDGQRCIFLDPDNPETSGAALLNPFAIGLKNHLTITFEHVLQRFDRVSQKAFEVARDLGDGWTVFYNGGKMGASAADHAHIQAMQEELPVENDVMHAWENRRDDPDAVKIVDLGTGDPDILSFIPTKVGRSIMVVAGKNLEATKHALDVAIDCLPRNDGHYEPDMNVVITCRNNDDGEKVYYAYLFPRKHKGFRPNSHRLPADDPNHVSAGFGALEMAGKMVFPIAEDFDKFAYDGEVDVEKAGEYMLRSWQDTSLPTECFYDSYELAA